MQGVTYGAVSQGAPGRVDAAVRKTVLYEARVLPAKLRTALGEGQLGFYVICEQ